MTILDTVPPDAATELTFPARDTGSADDAYGITGSATWHPAAWIAGICSAYLLGWAASRIGRGVLERRD